MTSVRIYLCALLITGLLAGAVTARADDLPAPELDITGEAPDDLEANIKSISPLLSGQAKTGEDEAALLLRLAAEEANIRILLNNYGYYDPVITLPTAAPYVVHIDTGPRYYNGAYKLVATAAYPVTLPTGPALGILPQAPALAAPLMQAEAKVLADLGDQGRPFADFVKRDYVVDHDARALSASLVLDAGPELAFGPVEVHGNLQTNSDFIHNRIPWKPGARYSNTQLATYRTALLETEVFSAVKMVPAEEPASDGTLPLTVEVVERKPRTVGGSLAYNTDRGPGVEAFWQHRNYWGGGQKLDLKAQGYLDLQSFESKLRLPDIPDRRTALILSLKAENQTSDAYASTGLTTEAGFERVFSRHWKGSIGTRLFTGTVDGDATADLSVPVSASFDSSDSELNPTQGARASFTLTPHSALVGGQAFYATWESRLSGYRSVAKKDAVILAGWLHAGGIVGGDVEDIPATSRFYAGGGGSVRGYEFRSIGERDAQGDPLGGTALLEGGVEIRTRLTEKIGGVVFAEAGSVSNTVLPDFSSPQYAAGVGVRYLTDFAPLRADIAIPLNAREGDAGFQFYISIGQAF